MRFGERKGKTVKIRRGAAAVTGRRFPSAEKPSHWERIPGRLENSKARFTPCQNSGSQKTCLSMQSPGSPRNRVAWDSNFPATKPWSLPCPLFQSSLPYRPEPADQESPCLIPHWENSLPG